MYSYSWEERIHKYSPASPLNVLVYTRCRTLLPKIASSEESQGLRIIFTGCQGKWRGSLVIPTEKYINVCANAARGLSLTTNKIGITAATLNDQVIHKYRS